MRKNFHNLIFCTLSTIFLIIFSEVFCTNVFTIFFHKFLSIFLHTFFEIFLKNCEENCGKIVMKYPTFLKAPHRGGVYFKIRHPPPLKFHNTFWGCTYPHYRTTACILKLHKICDNIIYLSFLSPLPCQIPLPLHELWNCFTNLAFFENWVGTQIWPQCCCFISRHRPRLSDPPGLRSWQILEFWGSFWSAKVLCHFVSI